MHSRSLATSLTATLCLAVYAPVLLPGGFSMLLEPAGCRHELVIEEEPTAGSACCSRCRGEQQPAKVESEKSAPHGPHAPHSDGCSCPLCPDDAPCRLCSLCLVCVASPMTVWESSPPAVDQVAYTSAVRPDAPVFGLLHVPRA
jgi:hypothetical protein